MAFPSSSSSLTVFFFFFFLFFIMLSLLHAMVGSGAVVEEKRSDECMNCPYLVVLGASMVDIGQNAAAMPKRSNAEFPPFGIDYFGHPASRYSNGRLFIDFLSQELGYGLLDPYLKSIGADFTHGVSFGSSGATAQNTTVIGNGTSSTGLFSFLVQVDQLRQFKDDVIKSMQHLPPIKDRSAMKLPSTKTLEESLVLIEMGLCDYLRAYLDIDRHVGALYVDLIINMMELGIKAILELGMKKFVVMNLYPMGCLPIFEGLEAFVEAELDSDGCVAKVNQVSDLHNMKLVEMIQRLRLEYTSATFVIFDANSLFLNAIRNSFLYGVKYPLDLCCGYFKKGEYITCGETGYVQGGEMYYDARIPCMDPSMYISWDGVHPVESFAYFMAQGIINGSFLHPPFTIKKSCTMISGHGQPLESNGLIFPAQ